jgi:hypothetical protein
MRRSPHSVQRREHAMVVGINVKALEIHLGIPVCTISIPTISFVSLKFCGSHSTGYSLIATGSIVGLYYLRED